MSCLTFKCLCSSNNLKNFLRDGSLTGTIVLQAQLVGKGTGVVTGGLHRLHTSGKFGGNRFLETTEDLSVQVQRKDGVDDLDRVLFKDHVVGEVLGLGSTKVLAFDGKVTRGGGEFENLIVRSCDVGSRERNQSTDRGVGGNQGDELGVHEFNGIGFASKEGVEEFFRDGKSFLGVGVLATVKLLADGVVTALKVLNTLLSNKNHINFNTGALQFLETSFGLPDHERVVTSAKTTVTRDAAEGNLLDLANSQKRKVNIFSANAFNQSTKDGLQSFREGTGGQDSILGTTDLSGSHKLHGHGDLLRVLHTGNAITDGVGLSIVDHSGTTSSVSISCKRSRCESGGNGEEGGKAQELHGVLSHSRVV
mmetsp:Transcript_15556/g.33918  ORF Transcript_15556/g.33918 Transcript_15556/m.33918 type:complete len:365 (-) Transcript_15556:40-1134(-)